MGTGLGIVPPFPPPTRTGQGQAGRKSSAGASAPAGSNSPGPGTGAAWTGVQPNIGAPLRRVPLPPCSPLHHGLHSIPIGPRMELTRKSLPSPLQPPLSLADFQAFPRRTPDSFAHPPPWGLWNGLVMVPLSLPRDSALPQILGQDGGAEESPSLVTQGHLCTDLVASPVHSCSIQGQFQKSKSKFPLGPMHGVEMIVCSRPSPPSPPPQVICSKVLWGGPTGPRCSIYW